MLPAALGDCLWVEYGDAGKPRRILIDGGLAGTYDAICERARRAGEECEVELLVITHVDADHIEGVVKLLSNLPRGLRFREVWFNGWRHLPNTRLGGPQGEKLTARLVDDGYSWNARLGHGPVAVPGDGALPRIDLDGGLTLTLLSPTPVELARLAPKWRRECEKAGLLPGSLAEAREALARDRRIGPRRLGPPNVKRLAAEPYTEDDAPANGSSIAFLLEHGGRSCLFGADAFPQVVAASLRRLLRDRGAARLAVDAYKVAHHGSRYNNSPDLLSLVDARHYLFSTNGDRFEHPDPQTVARILKGRADSGAQGRATLCFNYETEQTRPWASTSLQDEWGYRAKYPPRGTAGIRVSL